MKKIFILFGLVVNLVSATFAQNSSPWPTSGNVGIGTTTPVSTLQVAGDVTMNVDVDAQQLTVSGITDKAKRLTIGYDVNGAGFGYIKSGWYGHQWTNLSLQPNGGNVGIGSSNPSTLFHVQIPIVKTNLATSTANIASYLSTNDATAPFGLRTMIFGGNSTAERYVTLQTTELFTVDGGNISLQPSGGNVGIGIASPATRLHVSGAGSSINGGNSYSINGSGIAVQANTGARSATTGAQLEFVIPANTDGSNLWGQARIITVAGTANSTDATGKMIIGTRRMFDKLGSGAQWYYGNDIVIDGVGNVGIGTLTPREALSVNGNIRSKQVVVETANWPDYVFKNYYTLPTLPEIKIYIDKNQHLPDVPSQEEIVKDGQNLGEMNKLLLKKVEELTLYLIEQDRQMKDMQLRISKLEQKSDK